MIECTMSACVTLVKCCPEEQTLSYKQVKAILAEGLIQTLDPELSPNLWLILLTWCSQHLSSRLMNCLLWRGKEGPQINTQHVSKIKAWGKICNCKFFPKLWIILFTWFCQQCWLTDKWRSACSVQVRPCFEKESQVENKHVSHISQSFGKKLVFQLLTQPLANTAYTILSAVLTFADIIVHHWLVCDWSRIVTS